MTTVDESDGHLSIGEVLAQLRADFPDVTISKIRFLESQGLVEPERTASGYRKFYAADVERLRWILVQQRDHFLPLRVIKDRLAAHGPGAPALDEGSPAPVGAGAEPSAESSPEAGAEIGPEAGSAPAWMAAARPAAAAGADPTTPEPPEAKGEAPEAAPAPRRKRRAPAPRLPLDEVADEVGTLSPPRPPRPARRRSRPAPEPVELTRRELAEASGLSDQQLGELEEYGLLVPALDGERALFDREALSVASAAAGFARRGIEPRHLRMYLHFAEREAALFAQVLRPLARPDDPEAGQRLDEEAAVLEQHGRDLFSALQPRTRRAALGT